MLKIAIVTGEINSGKTTWCMENLLGCSFDKSRSVIKNSCWKNNRINGILQIKLNAGRYRIGYDVLNISSGEYLPMVRHRSFLPREWKEAFTFGDFSFSRDGVEHGVRWIRESFKHERPVVIDEIGPVEINGLGFYDVLNELLWGENKVSEVYLVVRKKALKEVLDTFGIKKFVLIDVDTIN